MAKKFKRINACDGFFCGSNVKKGSLPVDRINEDELKEFIREYQESSSNEEWIKEWIKEILQNIDEDWMKEFICSLDCGSAGEGDFDIDPKVLTFEAVGGKLPLRVITDAKTAWTVMK